MPCSHTVTQAGPAWQKPPEPQLKSMEPARPVPSMLAGGHRVETEHCPSQPEKRPGQGPECQSSQRCHQHGLPQRDTQQGSRKQPAGVRPLSGLGWFWFCWTSHVPHSQHPCAYLEGSHRVLTDLSWPGSGCPGWAPHVRPGASPAVESFCSCPQPAQGPMSPPSPATCSSVPPHTAGRQDRA